MANQVKSVERVLKPLTPKEKKYVSARTKGKNQKDSALEAGYSLSTANRACVIEDRKEVQRAFRVLLQEAIPASLLIQRLREGLDADKVQVTGEGEQAFAEVAPDYKERREYLKLAATYGDYVPKEAVEMPGGLQPIVQIHIGIPSIPERKNPAELKPEFEGKVIEGE